MTSIALIYSGFFFYLTLFIRELILYLLYKYYATIPKNIDCLFYVISGICLIATLAGLFVCKTDFICLYVCPVIFALLHYTIKKVGFCINILMFLLHLFKAILNFDHIITVYYQCIYKQQVFLVNVHFCRVYFKKLLNIVKCSEKNIIVHN